MQNLYDFRESAELRLRVYLSMETERVIGELNSYDLVVGIEK